jgi:hypothetical protein
MPSPHTLNRQVTVSGVRPWYARADGGLSEFLELPGSAKDKEAGRAPTVAHPLLDAARPDDTRDPLAQSRSVCPSDAAVHLPAVEPTFGWALYAPVARAAATFSNCRACPRDAPLPGYSGG